MQDHGVRSVWILTHDPGAVAFYEACGFAAEPEPETLLTRSSSTISPPEGPGRWQQ